MAQTSFPHTKRRNKESLGDVIFPYMFHPSPYILLKSQSHRHTFSVAQYEVRSKALMLFCSASLIADIWCFSCWEPRFSPHPLRPANKHIFSLFMVVMTTLLKRLRARCWTCACACLFLGVSVVVGWLCWCAGCADLVGGLKRRRTLG